MRPGEVEVDVPQRRAAMCLKHPFLLQIDLAVPRQGQPKYTLLKIIKGSLLKNIVVFPHLKKVDNCLYF